MLNLRFLVLLVLLVGCSQSRSPIPVNALPAEVPTFDVLVNEMEDRAGYIFLRRTVNPGMQVMVNLQGEIMWYIAGDTTLFRAFHPYENSYVALHSDKELVEIGYNGDTLSYLVFGEGGFDRTLHHELIKYEGNYIGLTKEQLRVQNPEGEIDTIISDGILVLSEKGEKVWHWSIDQVIDPDTVKDITKYRKDWGHANALDVDTDGNYLVSWRDFNAIWKIDAEDGHLMWEYASDGISDVADQFYKQHAIQRNSEGDYMMFDNGLPRVRPVTRALAFREEGGAFTNTLSIALPDSLFSFKQGSVEQIDTNHFLFSSTQTGYLVITNRQGDILWLAKSDASFYRAYFLPETVLR